VNTRYQPIWQQAAPLLGVRSNDVHTRYCYVFAEALCDLHPEADREIVVPAILLHDIGWNTVPPDKLLVAFGPHMQYPELRRQHEVEGARLARRILASVGWPAERSGAIAKIIDGHDTRSDALSLEDGLVKDADKLWRYKLDRQLDLLAEWTRTRFFDDAARHMAIGLLTGLRAESEVGRG